MRLLSNSAGILVIAALAAAGCSRASEPAAERPTAPDAAGSTAAAAMPSGPRLFVTNEVGGDMTVIDVGTQKAIATIPLGKRPRGLRVSPDGTLIYVALSGSPIGGPNVDESTLPPADKTADGIGIVSVRELKLLKTIPAGSDPEQVAVSTDGKQLFATNEDVSQASMLDAADGTVLATFNVGEEPEGVDIRPDGKVVYVTSEGDSQVAVIDVGTRKLIKVFPVGPRPRSTAFLPDSSRAYVPSENGASIAVVDARAHRVLQTIKLEGGPLVRPMGTAVSPDGTLLFATTGRGKHVLLIDTATNKQVGAVEVGERPWGVAVSHDGRTVFTANGTSNDVSIVDVATRTVTAKVAAGNRPWGVVYVP